MKIFTLVVFTLIWAIRSFSSPAKESPDSVTEALSSNEVDAIAEINTSYLVEIKPLLKRTCLDCHGISEQLPWYYQIPGIKHWMNSHMTEAKEKLDMSNDFPFKSKDNPKKDLEEIIEVIEESEMPPWYYKGLHRDSLLTESEEKILIDWAKTSLQKLAK